MMVRGIGSRGERSIGDVQLLLHHQLHLQPHLPICPEQHGGQQLFVSFISPVFVLRQPSPHPVVVSYRTAVQDVMSRSIPRTGTVGAAYRPSTVHTARLPDPWNPFKACTAESNMPAEQRSRSSTGQASLAARRN